MSSLFNRKLISLFAGFSVVGAVTTLFSLGAIYVLLEIFETHLIFTYVFIYIITILLSYILNSYYVFKSSLGKNKAVKYFTIYISGMVIGVIVLWIFEATLPFKEFILAFMVLPITMMWNFVLSLKLFKNKHKC